MSVTFSIPVRSHLAFVCLVAVLLLVGSPLSEGAKSKNNQILDQSEKARAAGAAQFNSGHFAAALEIYRPALKAARSRHDFQGMLKLENNIGSVYFALFHYQEAIQSYLTTRDLALEQGLPEIAGVVDLNLVSLYITLGDLDAADRTAERALLLVTRRDPFKVRHQLLACLAELRAKQGRKSEAQQYYRSAIAAADQAADANALANVEDHLGIFFMVNGDYSSAELPLLDAFRLRILAHDRDLRCSYVYLAWLRIMQGDLRSGAALLDRARAMPQTDIGEPDCFLTYLQGLLAQQQGRSQAALGFFSAAFRDALIWQREAGPTDDLRSLSYTSDAVHRIYTAAVEAGIRFDPRKGTLGFEATELYRAAALRQTLVTGRGWLNSLPPDYWQLRNRLRVVQVVEFAQHQDENLRQIANFRHALLEFESSHTPVSTRSFEKNSPRQTLRSIQASLRPEEALISFYAGEGSCALWAVTRRQITLYTLPAKTEIQALADRFVSAVRNHRRTAAARELYRKLFAKLDPEYRDKTTWIISADDLLYAVPFAALEMQEEGEVPMYLLEKHATLQIPSATMLTGELRQEGGSDFVGLGDGIYNSADQRWRQRKISVYPSFPFFSFSSRLKFQLPRLAGSGPELDACALAWNPSMKPVLLKGAQASRESLRSALKQHPAVLHIAAHVVAPAPNQPEESAIALGLTPDGQQDVLTTDDIAGLDAPEATVVMSGCSSASGPEVSGKGVLGLTRAWLLAGARAVVGSRWPTPDDTGELFQSFYRHFRSRKGDRDRTRAVAKSLHEAQLEMLHSKSWRSDPWYWCAFYALGKE